MTKPSASEAHPGRQGATLFNPNGVVSFRRLPMAQSLAQVLGLKRRMDEKHVRNPFGVCRFSCHPSVEEVDLGLERVSFALS